MNTKVFSPELRGHLQEFDPVRLTAEVIETGETWADRDAAASALEEARKTILAELTLEYIAVAAVESSGGDAKATRTGMPASRAEMKALADPRYKEHLSQMVLRRKDANRARVRYDMGRMKLELMRSLQSTLRNEMYLNR